MVGHTGDFYAALIGIESVYLALYRLINSVKSAQGVLIVTSDHGNSDEMFETDKNGNPVLGKDGRPKPKTSHTLNPVPFIIYDPLFNGEYKLRNLENRGLSNIASTCIMLLGFEPPDFYDPSLIEFV